MRPKLHETRKVLFESIVDVVVLIRCDLKVLLELMNRTWHTSKQKIYSFMAHLEQILLVAQRLFLLVSKFCKRFVMPIEIGKLDNRSVD
jgi:hypothetical protein